MDLRHFVHEVKCAISAAKWTLLCAAALLPALGKDAQAQTPYLVDDIYPGAATSASSNPTAPVEYGGYVYFGADNGFGAQLWRTDGTSGGTTMVKQIYSQNLTLSISTIRIASLTVVNGLILFAARDANGVQLWRSDGTESGTFMVTQINPSQSGVSALTWGYRPFAVIGTNAYFIASNGIDGRELWKSDGTAAGTMMVKDIDPTGNSFSGAQSTDELIVSGGSLYFVSTASAGQSLWKSDGTSATTVQICTLNLGGALSSLTAMGGSVYFYDRNGSNVGMLWKTDGTPGNRTAIETLVAFSLIPYQSSLYFWSLVGGVFNLMRTDGTAGAAAAVLDSGGAAVSSSVHNAAAANGFLFFTGKDATNGVELWQTDGTQPGTHLTLDIVPGAGNSSPQGMTAVGNKLIFQVLGSGQQNIWVSDGSAVNTVAVGASTFTSGRWDWCSLGSSIFFRAKDANGEEPWLTDGTLAGSHQIADIGQTIHSSNPNSFYPGETRALFLATDPTHGFEMWASDGTTSGTALQADLVAGSGSGGDTLFGSAFGEMNGFIYFLYPQAALGLQLWRTDGTPGGTGFLKQIFADTNGYSIKRFAKAGLYLYFETYDSTNGFSIYRTDGTDPGTIFLGYGTLAEHPVYSGGFLYYNGYDSMLHSGIMRTDGTPGGTSLYLASPEPIDQSQFFNGRYFFSQQTGSYYSGTSTVVASDGTTASEQILFQGDFDYNPTFPQLVGVQQIVFAGNLAFFSFQGQLLPSSFWATDGTVGGTVKLLDSCPLGVTAIGNRVLFQSLDGSNGVELWISDGTPGGTHILKDINPGIASSNPTSFNAVGGRLYFLADDGTHGREFWVSDGTAAGTQLLGEIAPGSAGIVSHYFTTVGARLIFEATTQSIGDELWAVDMVGVGGPLIWADFNWTGAELGSQPNPYRTLLGGLNVVDSGGTVRIKPGATNETMRITQQVRIEASGGTARLGGL